MSTVALVGGFILDSLTLRRVDLLLENLAFVGYLTVAALGIWLWRSTRLAWLRPWLPVVIQFVFGATFSGFVVFYSRAGSLASSWPFLLILVGVMVANELLRTYYERLEYQLTIFYFALFSYLIFLVPVIARQIGAGVFVVSLVASLGLIYGFVWLLRADRRLLAGPLTVAAVITLFYFTNVLPPIPLALKEADVYHAIVRTTTGYQAWREPRAWWSWRPPVIHLAPGGVLYAWSAVFAPTRLAVPIVHEWQWYDEAAGEWRTVGRAQFSINGGRDGGYRGYSYRSDLLPGSWRVNVETERGALVGRIKFTVQRASLPPALETVER